MRKPRPVGVRWPPTGCLTCELQSQGQPRFCVNYLSYPQITASHSGNLCTHGIAALPPADTQAWLFYRWQAAAKHIASYCQSYKVYLWDFHSDRTIHKGRQCFPQMTLKILGQIVRKRAMMWATKMAQRVKCSCCQVSGPEFDPRTHTVEGDNHFLRADLWPSRMRHGVCSPPQKKTKYVLILIK